MMGQGDLSRSGFIGGRGRRSEESAAMPTESPRSFSRQSRAARAWGPNGTEYSRVQGWSWG